LNFGGREQLLPQLKENNSAAKHPLSLSRVIQNNWRESTKFSVVGPQDWPVSAVKLVDVLAGESPATAVSQLAL
jgi:hypothetical protein